MLSVDRTEAYGKVLFYWVLLIVGVLATSAIPALTDAELKALGRGTTIGVALSAGLLLVEVLFDQPLMRLLFQLVPSVRIAPKHLQIQDERVIGIGDYVLNRNVGVLSLVLWPTLFLMRSGLSGRILSAASVALATLTVVAVFPSEHETSKLAMIFSGVAFVGCLYAAPVMRALILVGWLVATLLVVPIALVSYQAGLHQANAIPQTGRNRIILWAFTAEEVKKRPWFGVGVASTKEIDDKAALTAKRPEGHTYPLRTGRHSHNIFMQTWYELGAVGAVLLAAFGVLFLRWMAALPPIVSAYAHAAFVTSVMIGAFSWGMWQTWFMAAYAVWALLLCIAIQLDLRVAHTEPALSLR